MSAAAADADVMFDILNAQLYYANKFLRINIINIIFSLFIHTTKFYAIINNI